MKNFEKYTFDSEEAIKAHKEWYAEKIELCVECVVYKSVIIALNVG